jgi:hypothetical protein
VTPESEARIGLVRHLMEKGLLKALHDEDSAYQHTFESLLHELRLLEKSLKHG